MTAESCTGGLLAARLTDRPGSSAYVAGGVVAYANEAKTELLGVEPELLASHGAVSEPVAEAMADGALNRFGADTAIAITGIAGPGGGTDDKPVGTVCFTVKLADGGNVHPHHPVTRRSVRYSRAVDDRRHAHVAPRAGRLTTARRLSEHLRVSRPPFDVMCSFVVAAPVALS